MLSVLSHKNICLFPPGLFRSCRTIKHGDKSVRNETMHVFYKKVRNCEDL